MYFTTTNPATGENVLYSRSSHKLESSLAKNILEELNRIELKTGKPYIFEIEIIDDSFKIISYDEIQLNPKAHISFLRRLHDFDKRHLDIDIETVRLLQIPTVESPQGDYIQFRDSLPGATVGKFVLTKEQAELAIAADEKFIFAVKELTPEILKLAELSEGFITPQAGLTSHAAVIARGRRKPALFVMPEMKITDSGISTDDVQISVGESVTIDGNRSRLYKGKQEIDTVDEKALSDLLEFMPKGDTSIGINTEKVEELKVGRSLGANGIGLLRLEHLVIQTELIDTFRRILIGNLLGKDIKSYSSNFLDGLYSHLVTLFEELNSDETITVRLLDPPTHEFLNLEEDDYISIAKDFNVPKEEIQQKVAQTSESNPMMGNRGVRLIILNNGLLELQLKVIARLIKNYPGKLKLEVPFISSEPEAKYILNQIELSLDQKGVPRKSYLLGVMFEIPSMLYFLDKILEKIDLLAFGTNDLTQFTLGLSRDDSDIITYEYAKLGISQLNPFQVIDQSSVGKILENAMQIIAQNKPKLSVSVCGEHAGDFESIKFFKSIGIENFSCSVSRIVEARLAIINQDR